MRRLPLLASFLVALLAGCGAEGASPKAARDVIAGDWEGAALAVPATRWPPRYASLAGSTIRGEPRCGAPDSAHRVRCTFDVTKKNGGGAAVSAAVQFDRNGVVEGWTIETVR
jgi:hypothetical protein